MEKKHIVFSIFLLVLLFLNIHFFLDISKFDVFSEMQMYDQWEDNQNKIIHLTFDDGPNMFSASILDVLKEYNAKATFFMLEPNMKRFPHIVERVLKEGHTIGLHGVTHDKNIIYASPQNVVNEMIQTNNTLYEITNTTSNLIRVPYGSYPWMVEEYRLAIEEEGFLMWDWNVDSGDVTANIVDFDIIFENTINNTKKEFLRKKRPVIIFHEKKDTLEALPFILKKLNGQGYVFYPLTEDMKPLNFWNYDKWYE